MYIAQSKLAEFWDIIQYTISTELYTILNGFINRESCIHWIHVIKD